LNEYADSPVIASYSRQEPGAHCSIGRELPPRSIATQDHDLDLEKQNAREQKRAPPNGLSVARVAQSAAADCYPVDLKLRQTVALGSTVKAMHRAMSQRGHDADKQDAKNLAGLFADEIQELLIGL
jgi:hypothetical protein